jgi:mRNA-degrading endonuclease RelE of RelBE toxin-antitoxin system
LYDVRITPEGLRHLDKLPDKIRAAAVEAITSTIAANPKRAGKALLGELQGLYSARRGDYRVIYEIDETARALVVHRVQHRRDVYRPR